MELKEILENLESELSRLTLEKPEGWQEQCEKIGRKINSLIFGNNKSKLPKYPL